MVISIFSVLGFPARSVLPNIYSSICQMGKYAYLFDEFHECDIIYKKLLELIPVHIKLVPVELYQIKSVESSSLFIVYPSIVL